jgi:hypothetical protein
MQKTVADATRLAEKESRYADTRDAAAAELALLEPKIAKIVVAVLDEGIAAEVTLDGSPLAAEEIGVPVAVTPGEVVIRASAPGKKPVEKRQAIRAGSTRTVTIAFESGASGPLPEPLPEPEPDEPGGGDFGAVRAAGIALAILGAGGLVGFAVTGSMAKERFDRLEEECGGFRCTDPAYADVIDEGQGLQTTAHVLVGVGSGLLVAGVLMIAFGGPSEDGSALVEPAQGGALFRF